MDGKSKLTSKRISIIREAALKQALGGSGAFDYAEPAIGEGIYKAKQLHIPDCPEGMVQFGMTLVDRVRSGAHSSMGPFYLLFRVSSHLPNAPQIIPDKFYVCGFVQKNIDWEVTIDPKKITMQGGIKTESISTGESEMQTPPDNKEGISDMLQESERTKCRTIDGVPTLQIKTEMVEEKPHKMMEGITATDATMDTMSEVQENLVACSSSQPQNIFKEAADKWYDTCNEQYKMTESLPFEIFMKSFIRHFYNTLINKNIDHLIRLLINDEMVVTHAAFLAFWALCHPKQEDFDSDALKQLSESSCFLAISWRAAETLLCSYDVHPGEALWLVRYSLGRPGILFLSWYTPNDKKRVFHEEVQWSKGENSEKNCFSSQVNGSKICGTTLKELARNVLAENKLLAVQCPMTWLEQITFCCRSQLGVLMDEEKQRRERKTDEDAMKKSTIAKQDDATCMTS